MVGDANTLLFSSIIVFGALGFSQYTNIFKLMCCETLLHNSTFVKFYRNIQVASVLMNEIQQWSINSIAALFYVVLQAVSLTALTRQKWAAKHFVPNIFFLYAFVASVIVKVGVFGLFARVNIKSEEMIKLLSKRNGIFVRERRSNKKMRICFCKSCNNIKVRFV